MTASRRLFLGSAGALAGAGVARAQVVPSRPEVPQGGAEPFYGAHQAGITTPMQDSLYFASFDLAAAKREDVVALLRIWTLGAARLTAGLPAEPGVQDVSSPGLDSGEALGLNPSRLTLTFGFGPDMFVLDGVDRYRIASKRPAALADLPRFAGDELVAGRCGGAICIQACANDAQVAFHAVRQLARMAYGAAELKWVQSGFSTANKTQGTPRNLMGFKDGTMNPSAVAAPAVVWANSDDWMNGGTYMVARRIRIALEHWDRMKIAFQEQTFGRQKISGAPLGGKTEFETPDFNAADADGNYVIPETSHVRLAAPVNNGGATILRRSYSYNEGANFVAERWPPWRQGIEYDSGLFFQAFQQDPRTGFVKLFEKMSKIDALNQFTTHVGSAVFACPPGVRAGGYVGEGLFGV
jgi:deferrochelatase/peroxidase EfeB